MSDTRTTVQLLRDAAKAAWREGDVTAATGFEARADHLEALMADAERECGGLTVDPRAFDKRIGMLEMNLAPRVDPPSATPEAPPDGTYRRCSWGAGTMDRCRQYAERNSEWCANHPTPRAPAASPRDTRPRCRKQPGKACESPWQCMNGPCPMEPVFTHAGADARVVPPVAAAPMGEQAVCKPWCGTNGPDYMTRNRHFCSSACRDAGRPLNPPRAPEGESR